MNRWDIINHFIKKNGYKNYLEIGYYKGWSFDQIQCEHKTAVDPNPSKFPDQQIAKHGWVLFDEDDPKKPIFKTTSDEFFQKITLSTNWDIIFIDGLHEANQVLRDVQNALKHLSPGGMIIMHDCNPPKYEHTTTGIDGCWTGDVYKTAMNLGVLFPNNFYVVDTDWGVGILHGLNEQIADTIPSSWYNTLKLDWDTFDRERTKLLNLITIQEFKTKENV